MSSGTKFGALLATLCLSVTQGQSLAARHLPQQPQRVVRAPALAGTYRLVVCASSSCSATDTTRAIAWGIIVFTDTDLPAATRARFPRSFHGNAVNGCFALSRSPRSGSLAGLDSNDVTVWRKEGDQYTFTLYRSPDAATDVRATLIGDTLQGIAKSWEVTGGYSQSTAVVHAIRTGSADPKLCTRAAPAKGR